MATIYHDYLKKFKLLLKYTPKFTKFTVINKIFSGEHALGPPSKRVAII